MSEMIETVETPSAEVAEVSTDTQGDIFADATFDKEFGLEPEPGQSEEVQPDALEVANPPASRQSEEVVEKEETEAEEVATPDAEEEAEPTDEKKSFKFNEKLNWDDERVPFKKEYKNLKQAYLELVESSVESQFLSSPNEFKDWMKQKSPTSYDEVGALLAQESAEQFPQKWLEFFKETNPDLLAEIATGREGMTAERLRAELEVLLDEDDEDVQAAIEKNKAAPEKTETPEQKEIREWREERERTARAQITSEVFAPIETEIDSLVSNAGLEIKESDYKGKNFAELDEDTQFRVMVNEFIPYWIDYRVKQDPKLVSMQARLEEFIQKKDKTSAAALSHPAKIASTNFAREVLSVMTGKKAQVKKAETQSPTTQKPQPIIKGANGRAVEDLKAPPDWTVTDADLN